MASEVNHGYASGQAGRAPRPTSPAPPLAVTARTPGSMPSARHDDPPDGEEGAAQDLTSSTVSDSPVSSPPYWMNPNPRAHQRNTSNVSTDSLPFGAITLRDNETNDRNDACWAKSVEIPDYTIVNGSATNIGAFVVYNVKVETLNRSYMTIRKRYSEFDEFRGRLVLSFPNFKTAIPDLPPKSVISRFQPRFLEKRRAGLQYFLHCILLNPEFSGSPVLKEFLFA